MINGVTTRPLFRYHRSVRPEMRAYRRAAWYAFGVPAAGLLVLSGVGDDRRGRYYLVLAATTICLVGGLAMAVRTFLQRRRSKRGPAVPPPATEVTEALGARTDAVRRLLPDRPWVLFRYGTLIEADTDADTGAGARDPQDAHRFALDRLAAAQPDRDFHVSRDENIGWLVSFSDSDVSVYLTAAEAKDDSTAGLGRCARAKLRLDQRHKTVLDTAATGTLAAAG